MRGTGDWAPNQRPENWRQMMLYLYPNGSAPLTGILSMLGSEPTDDPHFHWWSKTLPKQRAAITGIFTDAALTTAYAGGGSQGDTLYIQGSEADLEQFKEGHQILIRQADDYRVDTNAKVISITLNGASSYLEVKLREDADAANDIDSADTALIVGNINPEGGGLHDAIAYDPDEFSNYTQILNNALNLTRTARRTRLRTGDAYQEAKRECLELHSIEMEKAFIWGVKSLETGANNKPERTMDGILSFIAKYAQENVDDFSLSADTRFDGQTWLQAGEEWLDERLEIIYRHGRTEKLGLIGSGALLGLQRLAKSGGQVQLEPTTTDYGLQVINWITPFGTLPLKTHPLFSYEPSNRNSLLIVEPQNLKYRYIDDTFFISDSEKRNTHPYVDGTEEGYLTECSLEVHFPQTMGYLNGIGKDNVA